MAIARTPDAEAELLWRWPSPPQPGEEVIVLDGDACVTMQHGRVLGIFQPGRHQLPGQVPDGVELWFCTTRRILGVKFGGPLAAGAKAFGEYAYRVDVPHALVIQVSATGDADAIGTFLTSTVVSALREALTLVDFHPGKIEEAQADAAKRIDDRWKSIGVSFEGFGSLQIH